MSTQISPSMTYYQPNPSASKKHKIGLMAAGGLIGMNAYYLPVKKDEFVQKAFDINKADINTQIAALAQAAKEVEEDNLSTESKMILQEMGISEDFKSITNKCIELDKKITDKKSADNIKNNFINNFEKYKKLPSLMDDISNRAYKAVKRTKLLWGLGIGAAIGFALGFLTSKN